MIDLRILVAFKQGVNKYCILHSKKDVDCTQTIIAF
jgi:hypothetical protein